LRFLGVKDINTVKDQFKTILLLEPYMFSSLLMSAKGQ